MVTGSGFISNDLGWIKLQISPNDPPVEVRDVTMDWTCFALWGPGTAAGVEKVTDSDVSNQAIPYLQSAWINITGAKVLAQRVSYVGELGWELYTIPEKAMQVWDLLFAAGQEFGLEVSGYKVLDALRLEKGYRYFTADVAPMENPFSAGRRASAQALDKSDFIGKQALVKVKAEAVKHKLCTLVLDGEDYLPLYGGEGSSTRVREVVS